jgi:hypothetical protein
MYETLIVVIIKQQTLQCSYMSLEWHHMVGWLVGWQQFCTGKHLASTS